MSNFIPVDDIFRSQIVVLARSWLGTPYRHNACMKQVGADCLGLLRGVYAELYQSEHIPEPPPYTPDWGETPDGRGNFPELLLAAARQHLNEIDHADCQAGDVILFRLFENGPIKHCAILTSATDMIHAYTRHHVCEVPITAWWQRHITHGFSFAQF